MPRIDEKTKSQRKERVWLEVRQSNGIRQSEISEQLNLENRTVNNYLRELRDEGKIIKEGQLWYSLPYHQTRLRRFALEPEEAMTLYLASRLFVKQQDRRNEPAESALYRLAEVLTSDVGVGQEIRQAAQELAQRPFDPNYPSIFREIIRGYIYRRKIKITYQPYKGPEFEALFSTYLIEPSAIGYSTYIIGYSTTVGDIRSYKMERIQTASITSEEYHIPASFPGLDILRSAWSIITGDELQRVVLRFSPAVKKRVLETQWHPSQQYGVDPEKPEHLRWWVDVASTTDMLPWIRGWGADVEVLEPELLRNQLQSEVKQYNRLYSITSTEKSPETRLLRLWGKTTSDPQLFHPALYHMFDVAHVALQLLSSHANPRWGQVLGRALNTNVSGLSEWLPWFIALHDIGKISVPFQAQNLAQKQRLVAEKFDFGPYSVEHKQLHHTLMGRMALADWAKSFPRSWRTVFLDMVSCHHGRYQQPEGRHNRLGATLQEPEEWGSLRQKAIEILQHTLLLSEPTNWPNPKNISAAIVALNGFTILCDWLGSDEDYFSPMPHTPLPNYLSISRQRAKSRVEDAGFFMPVVSQSPTAFSDLFGWQPRPLQNAIDDIPDDLLTEPTLTIIESLTGEGKTEAAFTLAHRIALAQGTDELYVALPTTATSNAMYGRLQQHLSERLMLPPDLVKLIHGQSFLVEDDLRIKPLNNGDGRLHPALGWFEPKKKSLLAPFGVGTVDQAELAALNVRHNALRLIGLAGKVIILDEVHAYDTYMTTIIVRMLQWFSAMGSSVILLSATLPVSRRQQLAAAYTGGQVELENSSAYPYLLTVNSTSFHSASPPPQTANKQIELHTLHFAEKDWAAKAEWLLEQTAMAGCVCWITNTVDRAQRIFQELLKIAPEEVDCILFHARFPLADRQTIEQEILAKYGPQENGRRPSKGIIIGTQVLEQSLDIDFDLMVSDLAPIDLLLQRIGRLHRHERPQRAASHSRPHVYINYELDGDQLPIIGADRFYTPYIMLKTWQVIDNKVVNAGELNLPDDYRPLIEAVYDQEPPAEDSHLWEAFQDLLQKQAILEDEAKLRLVKEPDPRRPFWKHDGIVFQEDEESADWMVAQTRYQERESITVIPMEMIDEEYGNLVNNSDPISLTQRAERDLQLKLLQQSVRLSHPGIVKALKSVERPALFTESALLKRCYPLWLGNGGFQIENLIVRLDTQLGIVIEK